MQFRVLSTNDADTESLDYVIVLGVMPLDTAGVAGNVPYTGWPL